MGLIEATRTCLSKYATFSGRASRPEYWWFFLAVILIQIVAGVLDTILFGSVTTTVSETVTGETSALNLDSGDGPISLIANLLLVLPMLSAAWRRMHDTGRRGILLLIPVLISLMTFSVLFLGIYGFTILERVGIDPEFLTSLAASLGVQGLITAAVLQFVMAVTILWWLTRPGDPEGNEFGPRPAA